ncbi:MAG: hypothetical protein QM811_25250 [Pirellulales bacterium]
MKRPIGHPQDFEKRQQVGQHPRDPHHGQRGEVVSQLAARPFHDGSAEAGAFDVGPEFLEFANQVGAVEVAARFADGKKDLHNARARFAVPGGRPARSAHKSGEKYAESGGLGIERVHKSGFRVRVSGFRKCRHAAFASERNPRERRTSVLRFF